MLFFSLVSLDHVSDLSTFFLMKVFFNCFDYIAKDGGDSEYNHFFFNNF